MFNRVFNEGDTHVSVTQLPHDTADAARLYGECVDRARKEVADTTVATLGAHNEVKVVMAQADFLAESRQHRVRVIFTINGKRYDFTSEVDSAGEDIAKAIGLEVLRQVSRLVLPYRARERAVA